MKTEFWFERWEKGEIGFHQHDFNEHMLAFISRLEIEPGAHVLVPLCGKSLDMLWLANQGYRVIGIEISELAVRDFFVENRLDFALERKPGMISYHGERISIICTDFFAVEKADLPPIEAVYDRASLIALPPEMRSGYASHLARLIDGGKSSLLVTLEYPQEEMRGPPFSVPLDQVRALFGAQFEIEDLYSEDCLAKEPRFRKKGLTRLDEQVSLLRKISR